MGRSDILEVAAGNMVNLQLGCRSRRRGGSISSLQLSCHPLSTPSLSRSIHECPGKRQARRKAKTWLAIPAGFEPATHGVEIRYSIQLSYGTVASATCQAVGLHSIANMKNPLPGQARSEPFPAAKRQTGTVDRCVWSALNAMFAPQASCRRSKGLASAMSCMRLFRYPFASAAMSPSPFRALLFETRLTVRAQGAPS